MTFRQKDEAQLIWAENVKRLRLEAEFLKQRILNDVLAQHDREFNDALARGGLAELSSSPEELRRLFADAGRRQLGSGNADGS